FSARERADLLLLVTALEAEPRQVRARCDLALAERELFFTARNLLPHVVLALQRGSRLIDIGDLDGVADFQCARVRLLLSDQHAKERRLTRSVRPDDTDDTAPR